jgi:sentrin-specific protease 1
MNFIRERSEVEGFSKAHCFNTFFFTKLANPSEGYTSIRRWTRRVDIFSKDIIIIPIHLGMHWVCGVIDFRIKAILYFDSLHGYRKDFFQLIAEYLEKEALDKKNMPFSTDNWLKLAPKVLMYSSLL